MQIPDIPMIAVDDGPVALYFNTKRETVEGPRELVAGNVAKIVQS